MENLESIAKERLQTQEKEQKIRFLMVKEQYKRLYHEVGIGGAITYLGGVGLLFSTALAMASG
ncbi:MAG: hypothetical protein ABIH20_04650, partial [Candidatus Diapherotrites archaeon]